MFPFASDSIDAVFRNPTAFREILQFVEVYTVIQPGVNHLEPSSFEPVLLIEAIGQPPDLHEQAQIHSDSLPFFVYRRFAGKLPPTIGADADRNGDILGAILPIRDPDITAEGPVLTALTVFTASHISLL